MLNYRKDKEKKGFNKLVETLSRNVIILVVIAFAIAGAVATVHILGTRKDDQKTDTGKVTTFEDTSSVYFAMYPPTSFNVCASSDEDVVYLDQIIYSSLFRLDDTLNVAPELVSSYETEPEEGAVYITLREAYFSDGSQVTSHDVRDTISAIKKVGSSSPYYRYVSKIDGIDIDDITNFKLYFTSSSDAALDNLVFPIISSGLYSSGESFAIGSGPYAYGKYEEGNILTLTPNQYYYDGVPAKNIEICFVKDKNSVPGLITMDAVTAYLSKDSDADAVAGDKSLGITEVTSGELEFLGFNLNSPMLSDRSFRQAIAKSIDRKAIIKDDYGSAAVISDSLYWPGFLGADTEKTILYEPKEATSILKSLGCSDSNEDGVLENVDGTRLSLRLLVCSDAGARVEAADSIANNLGNLGIEVNVIKTSQADMDSKLGSGDFDMYLAGINMDKQFRMSELFFTANCTGFSDTDVLSQISELEKCHSAEELVTIFASLKEALNDRIPYYCICYKTYSLLTVDTFESPVKPQYFNPYRSCEKWEWKKRVTTEQAADASDGGSTKTKE